VKILATSGGFLPTDLGPFQWQRGPLIGTRSISLATRTASGSATSAPPPATA
jgi:hypothetical protein